MAASHLHRTPSDVLARGRRPAAAQAGAAALVTAGGCTAHMKLMSISAMPMPADIAKRASAASGPCPTSNWPLL